MPVTEWTPDALDAAVAEGQPVLVDLKAEWCAQCGPQERVLERLVPDFEERVRFGSIDVGEHEGIVDRFGIQGLPAMLLFDAGEHRTTLKGFKRAPLIRQHLMELLGS